jgi:hypothetical protein
MKKIIFLYILFSAIQAYSQGKLKIEGKYNLPLYGQNETQKFTFSVFSNLAENRELVSDSVDFDGNFNVTIDIEKPQPLFWIMPTADRRSELPLRTLWAGKGNFKINLYSIYDVQQSWNAYNNAAYHIYFEGDYETENKFLEKLYRADSRFINIYSNDITGKIRTNPEKYFYSVDSAYIAIKQEYDKIKNLKLSSGFHEFAQAELENFVYSHKISFLLIKSSYDLYNKNQDVQDNTAKLSQEDADKYISLQVEKLSAQPISVLSLSPYCRSAWLSYLYYEWIKKITDNGQIAIGDFSSNDVKAFDNLIKQKFAQKPVYHENLTALVISEGMMTILRTEKNIKVFREWVTDFHTAFPKSVYYLSLQNKLEKRSEQILQEPTYQADTTAVIADTAMIDPTSSLEQDIASTLYETEKKAPAYGLADLKGKNINLADLKGNVVCVFLWNQYAEPLIRQLAYSKWLTESFKGQPVKLMILDTSAQPDLANVMKTLKLKLPVMNIKDNKEGQKFKDDYADLYTYGYYFLIDKTGTIWQYNYGENIKNAIDYLLEK